MKTSIILKSRWVGLRTEQRPAQRPPRELGVLILDGILELCPGRGGIRCYNDWLVTMVLHVLLCRGSSCATNGCPLSCTTLNFLTNFYVGEKPLGNNDQSLKPNSILHIKAKSFLYRFHTHWIFRGYNYCISNEYYALLYNDEEKCTMPDAFAMLSGSEVSALRDSEAGGRARWQQMSYGMF